MSLDLRNGLDIIVRSKFERSAKSAFRFRDAAGKKLRAGPVVPSLAGLLYQQGLAQERGAACSYFFLNSTQLPVRTCSQPSLPQFLRSQEPPFFSPACASCMSNLAPAGLKILSVL